MTKIDVITDFRRVDSALWNQLDERSVGTSIFTSLAWQRTWWDAFGRGQLFLVILRRGDQPVSIAPLFVDGRMAFFVGSGGSDYLDFVGDVPTENEVETIFRLVSDLAPDLLGLRLYNVPDSSLTGQLVQTAAHQLGWTAYDEGHLIAPFLDASEPETWQAVIGKKSLRRAENSLRRQGDLTVEHLTTAADIVPHLDAFFDQHISRWESTPFPSMFHDENQRRFYRSIVTAEPDWLLFTCVKWNGSPIAFHLGAMHRRSLLWYKPTFDVELSRWSPGEVLLRHLLVHACDQGAVEFDMGLGDEPFKGRFTNGFRTVRTWGVYPADGD